MVELVEIFYLTRASMFQIAQSAELQPGCKVLTLTHAMQESVFVVSYAKAKHQTIRINQLLGEKKTKRRQYCLFNLFRLCITKLQTYFTLPCLAKTCSGFFQCSEHHILCCGVVIGQKHSNGDITGSAWQLKVGTKTLKLVIEENVYERVLNTTAGISTYRL